VACCCLGANANGLFPYVETTRWKCSGSRNSPSWLKLRVHLRCSSIGDLELFGPNSVGVNHNILITNIPLGSFLYGQIAAMVYDSNGQRMSVMDNRTGTIDTMIVCMGVKCYSTTFFVWGCITLLGLASSIVLFRRTKPAYATAASRSSSCKHLQQVSRETP